MRTEGLMSVNGSSRETSLKTFKYLNQLGRNLSSQKLVAQALDSSLTYLLSLLSTQLLQLIFVISGRITPVFNPLFNIITCLVLVPILMFYHFSFFGLMFTWQPYFFSLFFSNFSYFTFVYFCSIHACRNC